MKISAEKPEKPHKLFGAVPPFAKGIPPKSILSLFRKWGKPRAPMPSEARAETGRPDKPYNAQWRSPDERRSKRRELNPRQASSLKGEKKWKK